MSYIHIKNNFFLVAISCVLSVSLTVKNPIYFVEGKSSIKQSLISDQVKDEFMKKAKLVIPYSKDSQLNNISRTLSQVSFKESYPNQTKKQFLRKIAVTVDNYNLKSENSHKRDHRWTSANGRIQKKNHTKEKYQQHLNEHDKLRRKALRFLTNENEIKRGGLYPPLFNIAPRALINANATCGQNGREEYCKLADAYPHKKSTTQCGICNAQSSDMAKQRPVHTILSNSNFGERWWQSPALQYGKHFEYVTISIDLRQEYQIFYIMLKSANSPRPSAWILEKSLDGVIYNPWQYFAVNDVDCKRRYGLPGQTGKYIFESDSEVICSVQFSKTLPLENGEIHVSLIKNRPGAEEQRHELLDFITTRHIRFRFQGMHSTTHLNNSVDWLLDEDSLHKRSFYSLKQIRISGRLNCHGHADKTIEYYSKTVGVFDFQENFINNSLMCACQHNTCGAQCTECCPIYNNQPFHDSSLNDAHICEICNCNGHAEKCVYDPELGRGVCTNCKHNTTGIECELCLPKYYRNYETQLNETCEPCDCNEMGSNGNCDPWDGRCNCLEGFAGEKCDICENGYYGSKCQKCECNINGTISNAECTTLCNCKLNVKGEKCDTCESGFYHLTYDNPNGCLPCWCAGIGFTCTSAHLPPITFETREGWAITDIMGNHIGMPTIDTKKKSLMYGMYDHISTDQIFWQAPKAYLGNRLTNYGSQLLMSLSWVTIRGDTSGRPTFGPNIIIVGHNGETIASGYDGFPNISNVAINVTIHELYWYHVPINLLISNEKPQISTTHHLNTVSRSEFLSILTSVEAIRIRGLFHTDQVETILERVAFFSGVSEVGQSSDLVEKCACPAGYTGLSCEICEFGYIRIVESTSIKQFPLGKCVPCPCNGHSNSCDLQSGNCGNCTHNTYGDRCERCQLGYYGNPLRGTINDCKPCACPLREKSNNFSPSCQLKSYNMDDTKIQEYICTQCPIGYTGDHCEKCDDGFFGNPLKVGSSCQPCDCDGGSCNSSSGECILCKDNTEGLQCERCKMGYWGDPVVGCLPCNCNKDGSDSDVCNSTNGQCLCKPQFTGKDCNICAAGFANTSLKCISCDCNPVGVEFEGICDPISGQCQCKKGYTGVKCDECSDGYFKNSATALGCTDCKCNLFGSNSSYCNKIGGQCACFSNTTGRTCETCLLGYWNLTKENGCSACQCDPDGSSSGQCDVYTGQCICKIGVTGRQCNECSDGFYGFSSQGCHQCSVCSAVGQVCDPRNGRCICPPYSRGVDCTQCLPGTWGWLPRTGCKQCDCDRNGSIGQECEPVQGQCLCREGYTGRKCNLCAIGYFGYPECRRCNCNIHGSYRQMDGSITCDSNGQCPCKALVVGLKCDTCMQSTFGLSVDNPEGCTRCFCFHRSTECEQSDWSWGHIRMKEKCYLRIQNTERHYESSTYKYSILSASANGIIHGEYTETEVINDLRILSCAFSNVTLKFSRNINHPLYFELPQQFYGDRISSYGGYIHFTIMINEAYIPIDRHVLRRFPLVQLHSHKSLILDYYENEGDEYDVNSVRKIFMHETLWRHRNNSHTLNRATFMAALQNIKHIFLRSSAYSLFKEVIIQNVYMDSAIYVNGSINAIAVGIEKCKCPDKYNGLSCQEPAEGYYRWRNMSALENGSIEDLIGKAVPCHCYGRSFHCDVESGMCTMCHNNTGGRHCDQCAEGYYGDPNSKYGCQPCPCPQTNRNFARGCRVQNGLVHCICKTGYEGPLCDRCSFGYFGDLLKINGSCMPCNCELNGTKAEGCNLNTGQCYCRSGITGRKCNRCEEPRHFIDRNGCKLCDNCTLELLTHAEANTYLLKDMQKDGNFTNLSAPYFMINKINDILDAFNTDNFTYKKAHNQLNRYKNGYMQDLIVVTENHTYRKQKLTANASKQYILAERLYNSISKLRHEIGFIEIDIMQNLQILHNYGEKNMNASYLEGLQEVHTYLEHIQAFQKNLSSQQSAAECAWDLLYYSGNVSQMVLNQYNNMELLFNQLNTTSYRVTDIRSYVIKSQHIHSIIMNYLQHSVDIKDKVVHDYVNVNIFNMDIMQSSNSNLLAKTNILFEKNSEYAALLSNITKEIKNQGSILSHTFFKNNNLHIEVKKHWLPKAKHHASILLETSSEYVSRLHLQPQFVKKAFFASMVYKNISEVIFVTHEISKTANEKVHYAHFSLFPTDRTSAIDRAKNSLLFSKSFGNESISLIHRVKELQAEIGKRDYRLDYIKNEILKIGLTTNNLSTLIHSLSLNKSSNMLLKSLTDAQNVSEKMKKVLTLSRFTLNNMKNLHRMMKILDPDWEIKLGLAEENISLSQTNIRLANISLKYIKEQTENLEAIFNKWNSTISTQLQDVRYKIAKAKHAAERIRVSLQSIGKNCIRTYTPNYYGFSITNRLKLSFAMPNSYEYSPLIYVEGNGHHYVRLDVYKNHVRMAWFLGGTNTIIVHPLEINSRDPKYDDAWYYIEANRTLNVGSLSVKRMSNYDIMQNARVVFGSTDTTHIGLNQSIYTRLYLGGYPHWNKTNAPVGLNVVVHTIEIDNKKLGVWNFIDTSGQCDGAMVGAHETKTGSIARYFNGYGYAEIMRFRSRPYRKNNFALQMSFKTLDENALLFLAVDYKNNRSVSVTLSRGRIIFYIDYGDDAKLLINTTRKYNTGHWIKIEAAREFVPKRGTESGMLKVNKEDAITGSPTVPIKTNSLPDLSEAVHYLGGVSPGFILSGTRAPGTDKAFLGCVMDVQVNGETYDPMDSSSYFGIESHCRNENTKAGFFGNGYIEFDSKSLKKRANIVFLFRTLQPDCVLLLSAYSPETIADYDEYDIKGNYSISLVDGSLQVWINSGREILKLASNSTLNDGKFHIIHVLKTGRKIELHIDDEIHHFENLKGKQISINLPREAGGLYIGGTPNFDTILQITPTTANFSGSIRDLIINNQTINFNDAIKFPNVNIGRDGPRMADDGPSKQIFESNEDSVHADITTEGCRRDNIYSYAPNAFKFGDNPNSFAKIKHSRVYFWRINLNISFDFRTFHPNGLILIAPGSRRKHKHYISLLLKDGKILLIIRGRRREEFQLGANLNNGVWHHFIMKFVDHKLQLFLETGNIEQKLTLQIKLPKKLSLTTTLWIGGLSPHPPKLPSDLLMRIEPFKGCLRYFSIDNYIQDLADPNTHMNIGQCFPNIEKGTYFPGDAYAIYRKKFHVGKFIDVRMHFRTAEVSGILLSISEVPGFPALSLELNNGNLIFSCDIGDGTPIRVISSVHKKYTLCDNKWHNLTASYNVSQISLAVDKYPMLLMNIPMPLKNKMHTNAPLFIGGIPDFAPSGCLVTRENFKGCLKNILIRNESKAWTDMDFLHNVLLGDCHVTLSDE